MSRARDDDAEVNVPLLARNSLDHPYSDDAPPYSPPDPLLHDLLFRPHPLNNHAAAQDPPYLRLPFFNKFVRLPSFFRPYSTITQSQRFYRFQTALGRRRGIIVCLLIFAILLLLVSLYFTILFNPPPLPSPIYPDMTTNTSARFLTLNIFMRPPGIRNNLSDYKDSRLEYLIRYVLPRYDVVALQEAFAFGTIRKDILIREARKLGFNYHIESMRKDIFDLSIDGGLLVLSRFKIVDSAVMEYERGVNNDCL
ncbi:hypothetical protein BC938DRAFT_477163 [Jimgerdemannia flammicorona]|uniref:Endonuclease/exonuclease/phosphatase n=1 Tax=Jimgerdemannia flammicorona TaxID=994334 RepID=A0A433PBL0_9FUNG|nr:hypothetical protein BC938DRAFT_477163 [Jimgerdemannia flammicorona]